MKKTRLLTFLLLFFITAKAQETFTISGTVSNQKGEVLSAATAFIDGSQRTVVTDDKGNFRFNNIAKGTYQIVVNMLGYNSIKQTVNVKEAAIQLSFVLPEKQITLNEVVVGDNSQRKEFLKIFTKYFMGESDNAKACKMLNPEVIDFSTEKTLVKATSDKFLIIENPNLGYHVKYLLRNFRYDKKLQTTIYDGECIFENMAGTPEQQQQRKINRQKAYTGSLMHYLRSLYKNTARQEGFLTYAVTGLGMGFAVDPNPINTEQIIKRTDSGFFSFSYKKSLHTVFDKKKASAEDKYTSGRIILEDLGKTGSILQLNAEIDSRGSYEHYKDILIQGYWGTKRIGDQLPLEYDPATDL
jgi:hypothetical protein